MLDVDDLNASLPLEVDRPASKPAPAIPTVPPPVQTFRRCHRDGLELDRFGDCARCTKERLEAEARKEKRAKIWLAAAVGVLLLMAGGWYASTKLDERRAKAHAARIAEANGRKLVVYTMSSCPACGIARNHLNQRGIPYVERAIDMDPAAFEELEKLNPNRSVPTFVIGDEVMVGIDPAGILLGQALARHGMLPASGSVPSATAKE